MGNKQEGLAICNVCSGFGQLTVGPGIGQDCWVCGGLGFVSSGCAPVTENQGDDSAEDNENKEAKVRKKTKKDVKND